MRKRFEQQLQLGQLPIEETQISHKEKAALNQLLAALMEIYCNKTYNKRIFKLLEGHLMKNKKQTGRKGMDLWTIFVLSQVRLCMNTSYEVVHNLANNHRTLRQIMGVETDFGHQRVTFGYQRIYDNVSLLSDDLIGQINATIVEFGHEKVFKKKEGTALHLKTDSYVVESNVHFPTDYNLLFDCARKCLDIISKFKKKHGIGGWRKSDDWRSSLKGLMRELGKTSSSGGKNKDQRLKRAAVNYTGKADLLLKKLQKDIPALPQKDEKDLCHGILLEHYTALLGKHIDLVKRRLVKGEAIPHGEKMFSIFETYTEWIKKGKSRPNVELGKRLSITSDQYHLIVDHYILENEQDRDTVIPTVDRLSERFKEITSWSFDKGYWKKENKAYLGQNVDEVIMPKLGRPNKSEQEEQDGHSFKRLKNKHSAIESNINELEHRGPDRCPDRGYQHYKRYISLGVCAFNLKKIGKRILENKAKENKKACPQYRQAA